MKNLYLLVFLIAISSSLLGQQNIIGSFEHDGETREYRLHIPSDYETGMSLPLVINMHGYGSNATEQELYTGFNSISDANDFFVVYPQGLEDNVGSSHWNAYFNSSVDDVGFLNLLIDYLYSDYNIDLSRVYSTGMSNGGFMSYRLACELSDRIAAIASVTGAMTFPQLDNCPIERAIPIMQIHGTTDAVVPFNGQDNFYPPIPEGVDFWVQHNACDTPTTTDVPDVNMDDNTTAILQQYNTCDAGTQVVFYTIEDGGHSWPGAFPLPGLGNTNQDFQASPTIWEFFNQFTHPSPTEGTVISSNKEVISDELIHAFPNPFSHHLTLKSEIAEAMTIQLFDATGRLIRLDNKEANTTVFSLKTARLSAGLYHIKVTTKSGVWTKKVIKE